jgi:hypothetical protein
MDQRPRVFLDTSVRHHSIDSRTLLRSNGQAWGGQTLWKIVEEDPTARVADRLRAELELLPQVADLARRDEIELLSHNEADIELLGTVRFPEERRSVFDDVPITKVKGPVQYSRYITPHPRMRLAGQTWRSLQVDFLKSLKHQRFLELQRACGVSQGGYLRENQLKDAFHIWCAEESGATHFLTTDFRLVNIVNREKTFPPRVRVVKPSELLSELKPSHR